MARSMQKKLEIVRKRADRFVDILSDVAAVVVLVMVSIGVIGVVARYFVGSPIAWTDETVAYLIPLYVALCAGALLARDRHISIEMLPKLRYVAEISLFAVSLVILASSIRMVVFAADFGLYFLGELGVRAWLVEICLPLGAAVMTLITGLNLVSIFTAAQGVEADGAERDHR